MENGEVRIIALIAENDRLSKALLKMNHDLMNAECASRMLSEVCDDQRKRLLKYEGNANHAVVEPVNPEEVFSPHTKVMQIEVFNHRL